MSSNDNSADFKALQQENQHLRKAIEELTILNEISTAISSTLSLDKIIQLIVDKCVRKLHVEQAAVSLLNVMDQKQAFQTMARKTDTTTATIPYRLDTHLTGWMLKNKSPLLLNDLSNDARFKDLSSKEFPVHSLISVPLMAKGQMIGVISVFNKKDDAGFNQEEQRMLAIIAAQSAQVLENARLLEEEKQLVQMREEMRTAEEIQARLLPTGSPDVPEYDVAGMSFSAREVGGDYYDFVETDTGHLVVCLGDVTGKGLPASLLMANVQATIRSQILVGQSPENCIANANRLMFESTSLGKFVTLFYGVLDPVNHTMAYCNAGHDHPMLFDSAGQLRRLETGGVVLGFVQKAMYKSDTFQFEPGSRLLVFSDGVTEAMNADDEPFGEEKLESLVRENLHLSAAALNDKILDAVRRHAGKTPQSDDLTLVTVGRNR